MSLRSRFGVLSIWLALTTFLLAMLATMITVNVSKSPGPLYDALFPVFAAIFALAAPVAHIAGFGFGIAAILRKDDRRGLGILGAGLNGLALALGMLLVYAALSGLAGFR